MISFFSPSEIVISWSLLDEIGEYFSWLGERVLVVASKKDRSSYLYNEFLGILKKIYEEVIIFWEFEDKIDYNIIDTGVLLAKDGKVDTIVAIGCEEAITIGKAISLFSTNNYFAASYFEEEIKNLASPISLVIYPFFPLYGLEVANFVYAYNPEDNQLWIFQHKYLSPRLVLINPKIYQFRTRDFIYYSSGIFATAIEAIIQNSENEFVNTLSLRAIDILRKYIFSAIREETDIKAREWVAISSIYSGLAISNSFPGLCYAISFGIKSKYPNLPIPLLNTIILPYVMEYNLTNLANRFVQITKALKDEIPKASIIEVALQSSEVMRKILGDIGIPATFSEVGVSKRHLSIIIDNALNFPFLKYLPRKITPEYMETLITSAT
jgi:alcohol dehydrogenase class IV